MKYYLSIQTQDIAENGAAEARPQPPLFDFLGIALTRKCTARCRICCFECSPQQTEELDGELVLRMIQEAAGIPEIKKIGFTGGEAMLREELLLTCIRRTKQYGMQASLTTNGFWAATAEAARLRLENLCSAGLDSLTVSMDQYHQEYVPLSCIRNIIHAVRNTDIRFLLAAGDSAGEHSAMRLLKELGEDAYEIQILIYPFMPVGLAENLKQFLMKDVNPAWSCHNQRMLSVLYDGSVYPCCSQAVYNSRLCEGNIHDMSLKDIMKRYQYLSLFAELTRHDFAWLLQKAGEYRIETSRQTQSACSLCHELFANPAFAERLRNDVMQERALSVLEALSHMQLKQENPAAAAESFSIKNVPYTMRVTADGRNPGWPETTGGTNTPAAVYVFEAEHLTEKTALHAITQAFRSCQGWFKSLPLGLPASIQVNSGPVHFIMHRQDKPGSSMYS